MFTRILQWIKEVWKRMIGQSTVKQALNVDIAISAPMAEALQVWSMLYANQASWLNDTVKSLNLPASIAGEIAKAVTIEMKVGITGGASDTPRATFLAAQFARIMPRLREKVEQGCAKGGLMIKPYVSAKRVDVDFVQADMFYPVKFDADGEIMSCIFADQRTVGDKYFTRLEYHNMTAAGCEIINQAYRSASRDNLGTQVDLGEIDDWADLLPQAVITGIDRPLFAYFRFPLANNVDPTSPLGVSCYARAVDLIQQADELWSNLIWEFEAGKKAIYVDDLAFKKDANGKSILPDRRLYRTIESVGSDIGDGNKLFQEWSPEFRDASLKSGLNTILQRIEFTCGLAYGTLSDPQSVEKTATEIVSSKQRTYATVVDTQKSLQSALEQLLWAMDVWATLAKLAPMGVYSTAFDFDDSTVVDRDMQFKQDLQLVGTGIMGKVEWRMRNFKEDEATAKAAIAAATAEQPVDQFGNQVR